MSARVLVAYSASTGFSSRHGAEVASEIAAVGELEVDVQPIAYVATIEPYVAVYLGWSSHSRAGQREMTRFLNRNAALLAGRRIWVVQRQPGVDPATESGRGVMRLSRLLVRHGVEAESYAGSGTHRRPASVPVPAPSPSPEAESLVLRGPVSA